MLPDVPHGSDFVQAGTDNVQLRPCLTPFVPTALCDVPQFVDKAKLWRRFWPVRSNSFQDRVVDPVNIPTIVRYLSTKHLLLHEIL